ncbi:GntR family transcriptional regulator [Sphingopyxis sp. MWB1]|uniref:GntR family transcriptional regulator n=1 Tax=Sphingopyxis sp. MWB1 TaxID=1537715 RepID=UPI000519F1CD|nr:GntR family transcriptional regulator [Sphingopyxis sp. MWB1]
MKKAAIEPIERRSIVDSIADRLRARILDNDLAEGDLLRQEAIAEAYAVSRMPVREALRQLEAEGLVVFHRHKGAVVSRLEPAEVEELFDLRIMIEPDLIRRAAARADAEDIAAAEAALIASEAAYDLRDVSHWGELNWQLHEAMYRPARRDRSLALVQMLNLNIDRYIRIQLSLGDASLDHARREHRELFELYKAGKGAAVAKLLKAHLTNARDALVKAFRD